MIVICELLGQHIGRQFQTELPRDRGGFGLCSVKLKSGALHVLWVRRLVSPDVGLWQYFFKRYLRRAFLAEPVMHVFGFQSHSTASLRCLPPFYRNVVSAWQRVGGTRNDQNILIVHPSNLPSPMKISELTASFAYRTLTRSELPLPNCVNKFPNISWPAVWQSIHLCRFIRPTLDSAWKIADGVLPTADRLIRFGLEIPPQCFCGHIESADHLFFDCPLAQQLWFWFISLANSYRRDFAPLTKEAVRFGISRTAAVPMGLQVLMHIIKHFLWLHRNNIRFNNANPNSKEVLEAVKSQFRFHLRIQQKHSSPSQFTNSWLAMGTFGITRNTCTQQPLARLPNLFSVVLRLHTAINRADFVSW